MRIKKTAGPYQEWHDLRRCVRDNDGPKGASAKLLDVGFLIPVLSRVRKQ
jgi:hypothetical protein